MCSLSLFSYNFPKKKQRERTFRCEWFDGLVVLFIVFRFREAYLELFNNCLVSIAEKKKPNKKNQPPTDLKNIEKICLWVY